MKNILFLSLFLLSFGLVAQEVAIDIAPSIIGNYSKTFFDKLQTKNLENNNDTLELPFFDDFSNSFVYPNQSFWDGCAAFINNNYAIDPISIGVASLDAIDSTGAVYSHFPFSASVVAENLTSRPINLNYSPADSIYLSFYYQCGGKGDTPEKNDSLLLEFSTPNTDWKTIWAVEGGTNMNYFQQVILPITDTIFLEKGFRFRFKNYASLGSNYEPSFNSNFDVWNIDYVRLDTARSVYDTINQDVAFVSNFSSMLKEYEAIPWEHFKPFASENTIDSLVYLYKNNGTHTQNINRQLVIKDLWGSGTGFSSLDDSENILAGETIHYAKQVNYIFNSTTADSACFEMKGFIKTDTTEARRAFRWNDTIRYQQKFLNYYSYDDASAESGYGIAGQGTSDAAVALKFNILKPDTLRGVNMFFNQVLNQANQNYFYLMVWANNNGIPGDTIVHQIGVRPQYSDSLNQFTYYALDTPVFVSGTIFVGWSKTTDDMLNIGFDKNRDASDKLFYNVDGSWQQSSLSGAIMLNPVFGKEIVSNIQTNIAEKSLLIYPNPASSIVNIHSETHSKDFIQIFDASGRMQYSGYVNESIDVSAWSEGLYIIKLVGNSGVITKRLIVSH